MTSRVTFKLLVEMAKVVGILMTLAEDPVRTSEEEYEVAPKFAVDVSSTVWTDSVPTKGKTEDFPMLDLDVETPERVPEFVGIVL